ncbi:ornithine decarboxylase [Cryptococcus wingfieldii CBS 7118]|uniref:ornithine decarboxylase n=1 Tax=Cryptococcus wingfieldii CBS 7118 TaxID=1295528 RepID=A0A1E3K4S2_9TREE|nr:ornithine decarboxylase [Cryptococcus wingfieldii CBS 7118]ODO07507.1 ornithine decarboxylase [Cryptococcus wingfieldii CBS 7118]
MTTTLTQNYMAPVAPVLSKQPPWTEQNFLQSRTTVNNMVRTLDPSAQLPYVPDMALPTPPATTASMLSTDDAHPALANVVDMPVHQLIQQTIATSTGVDLDESAFFAADLSAVYQSVQRWRASPIGSRVEIFYAVKCNPSPAVLHLLSLMGTSFDCASSSEINQVLALPSAPAGDRIIFANPCKPASFIRTAAQKDVSMMTFDNADELYKIKRIYPNAKLVLRILTDDSKSLCRLGLKFGAPLDSCPGLLKLARQLGLNVIGVSFHVGSGCKDPMQFADAVWRARKVFDMGKEAGYDFGLLDIGGGFEHETFKEMTEVLNDSFELYFPASSGVRIIAEPGRFLVSSAFTLATSIIAARRAIGAEAGKEQAQAVAQEEAKSADVMYYINDGVYGSFNCIMFDHQIVHPHPLTIAHERAMVEPPFPPLPNVAVDVDLPVQMGYTDVETASVWGPTCDSIDCVRQLVDLPRGMDVGDWIGWSEMGAYTLCAASTFNGFEKSPVLWTTGGHSEDALAVRAILDSYNATFLR